MATPLTDAIAQRLARMFPLSEQAHVASVLMEECGDNLATGSAGIERIRIAVLKLSGADLDALRRAIDLAKVDWRDVLMAAGFGRDSTAHHSWWPDALSGKSDP
jgi:hypothetical protein